MSTVITIIMNLAFMASVIVSSPIDQVMYSDEVIQGNALDSLHKSYRPVNIKVDRDAIDKIVSDYNIY